MVDDVYREIINIGRHNVPMVDYHVYLRGGMSLKDALRKSRHDGIQYGVTASISVVKNDAGAERWLNPLQGKPVFFAFDIGTGSWKRAISVNTARQFDYILGDSRTWKSTQAASLNDPQEFLDSLIDQTVERLNAEPIDIYSHATCLPAKLQPQANELWTEARQAKLIDALVKNKVAIELNSLDQLPGQAFLQRAKQAGCKFAFGTANQTAAELKRCEYGLEMVHQCNLDWRNFYSPGAWWPKAADRA